MTHPLSFADISIFSPKISNFIISRNADIDCILDELGGGGCRWVEVGARFSNTHNLIEIYGIYKILMKFMECI